SGAMRLRAEEERVVAGGVAAARDAADFLAVRIGPVEAADQAISLEGERIAEQEEMRRRLGRNADPAAPRRLRRVRVWKPVRVEVERMERDPRQHARGQRDRTPVLDLPTRADHAPRRAAEHEAR